MRFNFRAIEMSLLKELIKITILSVVPDALKWVKSKLSKDHATNTAIEDNTKNETRGKDGSKAKSE